MKLRPTAHGFAKKRQLAAVILCAISVLLALSFPAHQEAARRAASEQTRPVGVEPPSRLSSGRNVGESYGLELTPGNAVSTFASLKRTSPQLDSVQASADDLWQFEQETTILSPGERAIVPQAYKTARLNREAMTELLNSAPLEFTEAARKSQVTMTLPLPGGGFASFRIEESPIMEAGLAARFPEIKTYRGQGLDDPAATLRFDWTPQGFHAMVLSEQGTIYIDPYAKGNTEHYVTYNKRDYRKDAAPFHCFVEGRKDAAVRPTREPAVQVSNGQTLRTYRLALAATGEYTQFQGGTVNGALAAMTTTMNRVNGIYERDLAIRMVFVANESSIIYTDPETDPYTITAPGALVNHNQANLDSTIGSANYDIGHVFSIGGGGYAPGLACVSESKAMGETGTSNPVGDGFDVDFVAHEMGHQFGANHTFNGVLGSCDVGYYFPTAYEPGSGSTIMAYAGICDCQNLQPHTDDYFHVASINEILTYITSGEGSCATQTATGNTPPTVNAGASYTIPKRTAFTLTATGSDANGDAVTYDWEEFDLGQPGLLDTDADGQARPIFRSFKPTSSRARTFPKQTDLLSNTITYGESLPNITRTMNFQVTARDNHSGGGGISTAAMQVNVEESKGPFVVTQPNTPTAWTVGSTQTVKWNVAGTTTRPVSCANVKISLSINGGQTFPITLTASTPNDGTHTFTVPNRPTTAARIKVEAVGNIFFDVSNLNFTIAQPSGCSFSTNSLTQNFSEAGGSGSVAVAAGGGCLWSAQSYASWVTIAPGGRTGNGTVNFSVASNSGPARNGKLSIAGRTFTVTQDAHGGVPDNSFGVCGTATFSESDRDEIHALALLPDGKIIAAGEENTANFKDFALLRINGDGSLDTSFGDGGDVFTDFSHLDDSGNAVALQPDGKIVVAGYFGINSTNYDFGLIRYNSDGSLDTSFGVGGKVRTAFTAGDDRAFGVVIQADGKIVVAGIARRNDSINSRFALARYNSDGSLDTSFGSGGKVMTTAGARGSGANALALQSDGRIVAGGFVMNNSGYIDFALIRYNANGTVDTSFGVSGRATANFPSASIESLALQADGKIVVAGQHSDTSSIALARFKSDGTLDADFGDGGKIITSIGSIASSALAMLIQPDNKIAVAGLAFTNVTYNFALARYNSDGSLDESFGTGGKVTTDFPVYPHQHAYALVMQPDGKLLAGGFSGGILQTQFAGFALARYESGLSVRTVQFSAHAFRADENGGPAPITITRTGDTSSPLSVRYTTSNGTATAGADYTGLSGALTFAIGETSKTLSVPITNDSVFEGDETLNLTLSFPSGATILGVPATAVLTISDNE